MTGMPRYVCQVPRSLVIPVLVFNSVRVAGDVTSVTVPADYLASLPDDTPVKVEVGRALGDRVEVLGAGLKAGDRIARLEPTDYELQLQDAEALLAQARSQARNAQANYERIEALYENNNASRSDLDAALASRRKRAA